MNIYPIPTTSPLEVRCDRSAFRSAGAAATSGAAHPQGRRSERGATFVELMLAVLIVSATVVGSTDSLRGSTEVYHYFADGGHEALMLAQEVHEAALLLPWSDPGESDPKFGPSVEVLDDLHEVTFSPPRSADYDVVASHLGWSQVVEVRKVDLNNPMEVVDPETFPGEVLTELRVTVLNGDVEAGVFSWWMSEPSHDA